MTTENCLVTAWTDHAEELRGWLRHNTGNAALSDEMLQDLFLKALRQGNGFCNLDNARAWLFKVARNLLVDHLRIAHHMVALPEDLTAHADDIDTVDIMTCRLPRVLAELNPHDREAITLCDLQGMSQAHFAKACGLSLSAARSRVRRARARLRAGMSVACQASLDEAGRAADVVTRN